MLPVCNMHGAARLATVHCTLYTRFQTLAHIVLSCGKGLIHSCALDCHQSHHTGDTHGAARLATIQAASLGLPNEAPLVSGIYLTPGANCELCCLSLHQVIIFNLGQVTQLGLVKAQ